MTIMQTACNQFRLFYVTCENQQKAESIASTLLNEKLIACANIFPPVIAMYPWHGQVEKTSETVMILKTVISSDNENSNRLADRLRDLTGYEIPCLIEIQPSHVNQDYLHWLMTGMGIKV